MPFANYYQDEYLIKIPIVYLRIHLEIPYQFDFCY